jgi:IS5 family transposase
MRRRAAVEPVIGHLKDDHRMRRNHLKGREGDRINAVLAAAGYNFSLLLRWLQDFLPVLLLIFRRRLAPPRAAAPRTIRRSEFFTTDRSNLA